MRDGKGKFYRLLRLSDEYKKIIRAYREAKYVLMYEREDRQEKKENNESS